MYFPSPSFFCAKMQVGWQMTKFDVIEALYIYSVVLALGTNRLVDYRLCR